MTPADYQATIHSRFLPSVDLWYAVEPLLPEPPGGGRPRKPARQMFSAIFYVLTTGCQWDALPRCLGASSTVHDRFQEWCAAGVFEQLWTSGLLEFDASVGLDWRWQSLDGAMTKAPLGGEATRPNPTDRGKSGTKRHLQTEGHGLPVGLTVSGAHRHDMTQVEAVFDSRPVVSFAPEQHLCADKGYDFDAVRSALSMAGYRSHIRPVLGRDGPGTGARGITLPGYRARRWVDWTDHGPERTHSWMNRFRRLLVRWEKKASNYLSLLHLACATIVWRRCPLTADDYLFG